MKMKKEKSAVALASRYADKSPRCPSSQCAMGIVYEAHDRQVRRIVALKCLRSEFGRGSIEFKRFQHEAESIGLLAVDGLLG